MFGVWLTVPLNGLVAHCEGTGFSWQASDLLIISGVFGDRRYKSCAWSKPCFTVHSLQGGFVPCQVKFNSLNKLYFAGMVQTKLRGYLPITKNSSEFFGHGNKPNCPWQAPTLLNAEKVGIIQTTPSQKWIFKFGTNSCRKGKFSWPKSSVPVK